MSVPQTENQTSADVIDFPLRPFRQEDTDQADDCWHIGEEWYFNLRGFGYLHTLIQRPHERIPVTELAGELKDPRTSVLKAINKAIDRLDDQPIIAGHFHEYVHWNSEVYWYNGCQQCWQWEFTAVNSLNKEYRTAG